MIWWNEYQKLAARTLLDEVPDYVTPPARAMAMQVVDLHQRASLITSLATSHDTYGIMTEWNLVGLVGEVGELAELVKKEVFHEHEIEIDKYKKEVGDILWYWAALCSKAGLSAQRVTEGLEQGLFAMALHQFWAELRRFVAHVPFSLEEAAQHNIDKLRQRYPNGFSSEDSVRRVDVAETAMEEEDRWR